MPAFGGALLGHSRAAEEVAHASAMVGLGRCAGLRRRAARCPARPWAGGRRRRGARPSPAACGLRRAAADRRRHVPALADVPASGDTPGVAAGLTVTVERRLAAHVAASRRAQTSSGSTAWCDRRTCACRPATPALAELLGARVRAHPRTARWRRAVEVGRPQRRPPRRRGREGPIETERARQVGRLVAGEYAAAAAEITALKVR